MKYGLIALVASFAFTGLALADIPPTNPPHLSDIPPTNPPHLSDIPPTHPPYG